MLFLFCSSFTVYSQNQARDIPAPQYQELTTGYTDFTRGVHFGQAPEIPAVQELARFFETKNIPRSNHRRSVKIVFSPLRTIPSLPADMPDGYRIILHSGRIDIDYTSSRAAMLAVRTLESLYNKHIRAVNARKRIPCYEVRGWMTDNDRIVARWTGPDSDIPLHAFAVEMRLTDPLKGWIGAGTTLERVGYHTSLYTGASVTYTDIETIRGQLAADGIDVLPVFDLSTANDRFEEITGHPMLSVEGMRFVRMLLEAYLNETSSVSIGFIVPEGRYRQQVREIVGCYPHITDLRFLSE